MGYAPLNSNRTAKPKRQLFFACSSLWIIEAWGGQKHAATAAETVAPKAAPESSGTVAKSRTATAVTATADAGYRRRGE
jgi:hypothetical protein